MFALWYGTLFYREYRDNLWNKLSSKQQPSPAPKETAIVIPLPPKKQEPSRIPLIEPSKSRTPSPQPPKTPTVPSPKPTPPASPTPPVVPSTPPTSTIRRDPPSPSTPPTRTLEPPPKPPRSPSPHPIRAEAFEEVDIDDEEEEEEEEEADEGSEVEEDEENSVISASPRRGPVANSVNDFINQEISSQKQTR